MASVRGSPPGGEDGRSRSRHSAPSHLGLPDWTRTRPRTRTRDDPRDRRHSRWTSPGRSARDRHPPHLRSRARGSLLHLAGPAGRSSRRRTRPRPVRGLRRRGPGGPLPRRGPHPPRRGRRASGPHDPGEREEPRPARRRGQGRQGPADHPDTGGGPVRPRLPRPPVRRLERRSSRDSAHTPLGGWLAADALVTVERSTRGGEFPWPDGFEALRARRYGEGTFWYGRAASTCEDAR